MAREVACACTLLVHFHTFATRRIIRAMSYIQRAPRLSTTASIVAALWLGLCPSTPVAIAAGDNEISPAAMRFKIDHLLNGLKVITLEDHHAPVVTLQIWY